MAGVLHIKQINFFPQQNEYNNIYENIKVQSNPIEMKKAAELSNQNLPNPVDNKENISIDREKTFTDQLPFIQFIHRREIIKLDQHSENFLKNENEKINQINKIELELPKQGKIEPNKLVNENNDEDDSGGSDGGNSNNGNNNENNEKSLSLNDYLNEHYQKLYTIHYAIEQIKNFIAVYEKQLTVYIEKSDTSKVTESNKKIKILKDYKNYLDYYYSRYLFLFNETIWWYNKSGLAICFDENLDITLRCSDRTAVRFRYWLALLAALFVGIAEGAIPGFFLFLLLMLLLSGPHAILIAFILGCVAGFSGFVVNFVMVRGALKETFRELACVGKTKWWDDTHKMSSFWKLFAAGLLALTAISYALLSYYTIHSTLVDAGTGSDAILTLVVSVFFGGIEFFLGAIFFKASFRLINQLCEGTFFDEYWHKPRACYGNWVILMWIITAVISLIMLFANLFTFHQSADTVFAHLAGHSAMVVLGPAAWAVAGINMTANFCLGWCNIMSVMMFFIDIYKNDIKFTREAKIKFIVMLGIAFILCLFNGIGQGALFDQTMRTSSDLIHLLGSHALTTVFADVSGGTEVIFSVCPNLQSCIESQDKSYPQYANPKNQELDDAIDGMSGIACAQQNN